VQSCDRILVIEAGRIVALGTPQAVKQGVAKQWGNHGA
jgi:ABC-type multidrug transport system ATPase subunit